MPFYLTPPVQWYEGEKLNGTSFAPKGSLPKKKNCEGSEYGPIGGGGGLEKSLLIVNLW